MQLIHPYLSDERSAMNRRYNIIIGILLFNIILLSTVPSSTKSRGRVRCPSRLRTRSCRPTLCPGAAQAPWPWCSPRASTTRAPGSAWTPGTPRARGSSPASWTATSSTKSRRRSRCPSRPQTKRSWPRTSCRGATRAPCPSCSSRASTTHAPGPTWTPGTPDRGKNATSEIRSSHLDKKLTDNSARMSVPNPPASKRNRLNGSAVHEEFTRVNITNPKTGKIVQGSECKHCPSIKTPLTSINPTNLKRHLESLHPDVFEKVRGKF